MSAREAIEAQAARWLLRREEAGWSEEDQQALDAWLDTSTAHQVAFWRLEHGWRRADRLAAHRTAGAAAPAAGWTRRLWKPGAIAASFLAIAAAGGWLAVGQGAQKTYATDVGGRETVPLPDGTRLELNTDTRLRSEVTEEERVVWLERGEAYFEVAHDSERPFVIYAGPRKVTVLGTKFSIRREGEAVEVAVLEGKVRVDVLKANEPVKPAILTPGQIAIARETETLVAPKTVAKVASELSWRHGVLTFDQYTLARAAEEFNRYNHRKIIVTDPAAGAIRIGGTFKSDNIEGFVELLEQGYGLEIQADENQVKIIG